LVVNLLETLYALTGLATIGFLVAALRRSSRWMRLCGLSAVIGALLSGMLYWALSRK
jgi:hypothetical protein